MKVLIVDDEPVTRELLKRILEKNLFCEVDEASSGAGAWALIGNTLAAHDPSSEKPLTPYDLCILDVMMPRGNGLELLSRVRSQPELAGMKVILCTALSARTSIAQAVGLTPDGSLVKPFTVHGVLDEVKRVLSAGAAGTIGGVASHPA